MANVIVSVPEQQTEKYDLYFAPLLADPKVNSLPFDIIVGEFKKRELYFMENLDKISYKKVACGWTYPEGNEATKKTLNPIEIAAPVQQCYTVLENTIFAGGLPTGWERGTLSPAIVDYLLTQQQYAFNRDLLTQVFLGDTALPTPYYAMMDGVYAKLLDGIANNDGTVDGGAITTSDVNPTNFFTTMNAIYNLQTRQLRGVPNANKVWIWTQALMDAYLNYLEISTQGTAGIIQTQYVVDGMTATRFKGIPIVVMEIVDERLETDFLTGSPAVPEDPYRCILTVGSNHKLLLDGDGFIKQNPWYSNDDDVYRVTGSATLAYDYGFGYYNVLAGLTS